MFDADNRDRNSLKSGLSGTPSLLGIRRRSTQHSNAPAASSPREDGAASDIVTAAKVPAVETTRSVLETPSYQRAKTI
jgi:hypothetical protein